MKLHYLMLIPGMIIHNLLTAQPDDTSFRIFKKHTAPVRALAFSIDGQILATGGDDKMIYLWDMKSGELSSGIDNNFAIRALQLTDENSILAACGTDIKLMDMDGRLNRTFKGYTTDIWSMDYNPGVHRLIAGSYAKTIKVWNFDNGDQVMTLTGHEKSCLPVRINPAGNMAVTGSLDRSVRLWNLESGMELKKLGIHTGNIFGVDFHPSGKYVVSASADKTIRLWSVETGKVIRTFAGHEGAVFNVRFSADGNHLLSCGSDKTIVLWETATGKELHVFEGHEATVNAVRFSNDGQSFASASDDHTVRIWKLEKKYYVEPYFGNDLEKAMKGSPLFGPRKTDETKQAYASREQEAKGFLDKLYEKYYVEYLNMIKKIDLEKTSDKPEKP